MVSFAVLDWAAWAPGLCERAAWTAWARAPFLPHGDAAPLLTEVPAMQRRRVDRLGRMAVQTAYWCPGQAGDDSAPILFASRHGDVARSVTLLNALAAHEALSPTAFGLSVHNAIAAFYSIVTGARGNYVVLASGRSTAEAACIEAAGLLAEGAPEVKLVCYDAPLPEDFAAYIDEPQAAYAWCWRIAPVERGGTRLQLHWGGPKTKPTATARSDSGLLPHGLEVHRFLLAGDAALSLVDDTGTWHWQRDD
jgi:hypothetical protein